MELPLGVFDVADITNALRRFSSRNRMGKIAINMEKPESLPHIQLLKHKTVFHPKKNYIMIGGLGGLGHSMSKWMMSGGARKYIFLGRPRLDKAPARRLVEDLESNGARCTVVRGEVCSMADIQKVVDSGETPIGSVIQTAMGLNNHYSQACRTNTGTQVLIPRCKAPGTFTTLSRAKTPSSTSS